MGYLWVLLSGVLSEQGSAEVSVAELGVVSGAASATATELVTVSSRDASKALKWAELSELKTAVWWVRHSDSPKARNLERKSVNSAAEMWAVG